MSWLLELYVLLKGVKLEEGVHELYKKRSR